MAPVSCLVEKMMNQIDQNIRDLMKIKGKVVDIDGVAIKNGHTGKKLLGKMIEMSCEEAKKQGFLYAYCFASNFKTAFSLARLGFEKIGETDCC